MSSTNQQIVLRPAEKRGRTDLGWLDSRHTFSFGGYRDPQQSGFRSLRVINDDRVAPGGGFAPHSHADMEIITWVLAGSLAHRDSLGGERTLEPGELQVMTAGSGLTHSEYNGSQTEAVHFLQMWILPRSRGVEPRYDQKRFDTAARRAGWQLLVSDDGRDGSLPIHQDAQLLVTELAAGDRRAVNVPAGRYGWLHVATGSATLDDQALAAGDGAAITGPFDGMLTTEGDAQVLLFRLD